MNYAFDIRQNPILFKDKEPQNSISEYHERNQGLMEQFIITPRNFEIDVQLKVSFFSFSFLGLK